MNKTQRKELDAICDLLRDLTDEETVKEMPIDDIKVKIEEAEGRVSTVAEEEREKFDNMSEGLQQTETGQTLEQNADILESISWPELDDEPLDEDALAGLMDEVQHVIDEIEALL